MGGCWSSRSHPRGGRASLDDGSQITGGRSRSRCRLGGVMRPVFARVTVVVLALLFARAEVARAAPDGTLTWGVHVTLAARWLDPSDTEAFITPFMVLYALHDALVKPMPGGDNTPSLAESWTVSKDGITYEFVLRKVPSVKRLVFKSMPDETTRAAALKAGDVDIVYLLSGPIAADVKRTPGLRLAAAMPPGVVFLDLPEQWDPKSPWHDRRVRLAASHGLDRNALNQAETLGLSRPTGRLIPRVLEFARAYDPPAYDPARAKKLLAEAGYPSGFDAGDLTPFPPFFSLAEAIGNYLQEIGIRTRIRTMERAAFLTAWREHKIKGVIMGLGAPAGNAATRVEVYVTRNGIYASGVVPEIEDLFQRQARELDRKKREAVLHKIQQIMHDRVLHVPIYELAFLWGVGPRVEEACVDWIKGFAYSAPYEDLRLKPGR